jgi:hypothetical protein
MLAAFAILFWIAGTCPVFLLAQNCSHCFMTLNLFVGLTGRQLWVSFSSQVKEEEVTGRKGTLFICEGTKCQSGTVGRI